MPLAFVIVEPANQFDFQFENVFLFYKFQSFLNILWSKLSTYKTKQTKLFDSFFLSKPWYINSEKNRPDLRSLFQIKKKKKKMDLPVSNFHQIVITYIFFWPYTSVLAYVLCVQKDQYIETVLLSTHQVCFG